MVDFEEGLKTFFTGTCALVFAFILEDVFTGLVDTLGSLTSFFTAVFFVVTFASLIAVSFLVAGFLVVEDFVALVVAVPDLDLEGAFFVEVALDALTGLFY